MNRTQSIVSAIVVLVVQLAAVAGYTVSSDMVTALVSGAVVIVATAYALWKNHNITDAAMQAQTVLKALKADADEDELQMIAESVEPREGE